MARRAAARLKARGWEADFCSILTDDSAEATIATSLAQPWDCIVIGAGSASRHAVFHCSSGSSTPSIGKLQGRR